MFLKYSSPPAHLTHPPSAHLLPAMSSNKSKVELGGEDALQPTLPLKGKQAEVLPLPYSHGAGDEGVSILHRLLHPAPEPEGARVSSDTAAQDCQGAGEQHNFGSPALLLTIAS